MPRLLLASPEIQFALEVDRAKKSDDYLRFFKLLNEANLLQACCMFRYVLEMRMMGLRRMARTFKPARQQATLPLKYVTHLFLFEDEDDCCAFLSHCNMPVSGGPDEPGATVTLTDPFTDLPLDENGHPLFPKPSKMCLNIEGAVPPFLPPSLRVCATLPPSQPIALPLATADLTLTLTLTPTLNLDTFHPTRIRRERGRRILLPRRTILSR
jgi:hypothetical protein